MAARMTVTGDRAVARQLLRLAREAADASVAVGFAADYAIYVHENLQAHHPVGQAKFLESAAREGEAQLRSIVESGLKRGLTLKQALLLAGLWLQGEAQRRVPVDTGNLRASAYTRAT